MENSQTHEKDVIVHLTNVCFSYNDSSHADAVHNVNLDIQRGQWLTIIGNNGSGKTTLSRMLAAISAPTSGTLSLFGETVFSDNHGIDRAAFIRARHHLAYMTQDPQDQIVGATVKDDVAFEPENLGWQPHDTARTVYESLARAGMDAFANSDPDNLSGGQQQRVALASAIAAHPELLILDEPFAFVDNAARQALIHTLEELHSAGTTIVIITHHSSVAKLSDRVIEMRDGEIVRDIPSSDYLVESHESTLAPTRENISHFGIPVSNHSSESAQEDSRDIVISAQDLSFMYGDSSSSRRNAQTIRDNHNSPHAHSVLDLTNFTISRGEFVTISGPNGSGKSTLLKLIAGVLKPHSGTIDTHHSRIGYVMQKPEQQLFASRVYDDVAFGPRNMGLSDDEVDDRVTQTLDFLGIENLADKSVWDLSGGQQRLVAFAGVLAMKPDVLLLDEPTAGIDAKTTSKLLTLFKSLHRSGITIIMVTHSLNHIQTVATRAIVLNNAEFLTETDTIESASSAVFDDKTAHGLAHASTSNTAPQSEFPLSVAPLSVAPLSRFDPRVLTIITLATMFTSFALYSPAQLAVGVIVASAYVMLSGIRPSQLVRRLHGFWIFIALMGVFNLFVVQTGHIVLHWGIIRITTAGIWSGILYSSRFALLAIIAVSMMHILPANRITDALESLCNPLSKRGLPVHELVLTTTLSLRFLPILTRDFRNLIIAQELRGASLTHGSIMTRVRSLQALIIPAFSHALRHADKLSIALDVRGFDNASQRIPWRVMHVTGRDYALIASYIVYLACIIGLSFVPAF